MRINPINFENYQRSANPVCNFRKSPSFSFPYNNVIPGNVNQYDFADKYEKEFFENLCKMKDEIYSHLDSLVLDDGMTIKEHFESMFDMNGASVTREKLLHKTDTSICYEIIKNGFDVSKISQTKYGPGIYFGTYSSDLTIYPGETLQARYEGRSATGYGLRNYEELSAKILNCLMNSYFDIKPQNCPMVLLIKAYNAVGKFINDYSRHVIADELGIDGAHAMGSDGYFIVFNPDAIKEVDYYKKYYN